MLAIAINALYTTLYKRGTTRQLAGAIVVCVVSALLLLLALEWYNQRFSVEQTAVSATEVAAVFVYVALWGWCLPLGATIAYCLFAQSRISHDSTRLPSPLKAAGSNNAYIGTPGLISHPTSAPGLGPLPAPLNLRSNEVSLPSYAPTTPAPYVYGEDTPWGWLEYGNGRLRGQQLELKQAVIKLGSGKDDDLWLDDERVVQHHAELVWSRGNVYIVNRNGVVLVNGQPIHGPTMLRQRDVFAVGSQGFMFAFARRDRRTEAGDPLEHHRGRSPVTPTPVSQNPAALTKPLRDDGDRYKPGDEYATIPSPSTARMTPPTPAPPAANPPLISGPVPLRLPSKPKKE